MTRSNVPATRAVVVLAIAMAGLGVRPAAAVGHLKRGMTPPPIALPDLDGQIVRTADLADRTLVLVFGELYHEKTLSACVEIRAALQSRELAGRPVTPLLIVGQDAPRDALRARAAKAELPWPVLHDVKRRAFGDYRVAALPSVVVVDRTGRVVHAQAGYVGRFRDILTDALLLSEGLLSAEELERTLHPVAEPGRNQEHARAARLTSLARQLVRRGLPQVAEEKYAEALEAMSTYAPARLGLGTLLLKRGRLAEAELEFREVLAGEPKSVDAGLGLAYVQVLRGGGELAEAETRLRGLLATNPGEPRANYLLGLVHQQRNEVEEAAASFRRAAELLMGRRGTWEALSTEGSG